MPLADDWVERLFTRFEEIYGATFTQLLDDPQDKNFRIFYKTIVANALNGLTNQEIKRGLYICNMYNYEPIPHPIEFWHRCKGIPYKMKKKERK